MLMVQVSRVKHMVSTSTQCGDAHNPYLRRGSQINILHNIRMQDLASMHGGIRHGIGLKMHISIFS